MIVFAQFQIADIIYLFKNCCEVLRRLFVKGSYYLINEAINELQDRNHDCTLYFKQDIKQNNLCKSDGGN